MNDFYRQNPDLSETRYKNISKEYFKSPNIKNIVLGTYNWIKSDPMFSIREGIKLNLRRHHRANAKSFNNSKLVQLFPSLIEDPNDIPKYLRPSY